MTLIAGVTLTRLVRALGQTRRTSVPVVDPTVKPPDVPIAADSMCGFYRGPSEPKKGLFSRPVYLFPNGILLTMLDAPGALMNVDGRGVMEATSFLANDTARRAVEAHVARTVQQHGNATNAQHLLAGIPSGTRFVRAEDITSASIVKSPILKGHLQIAFHLRSGETVGRASLPAAQFDTLRPALAKIAGVRVEDRSRAA
jgi:hypothetical protein